MLYSTATRARNELLVCWAAACYQDPGDDHIAHRCSASWENESKASKNGSPSRRSDANIKRNAKNKQACRRAGMQACMQCSRRAGTMGEKAARQPGSQGRQCSQAASQPISQAARQPGQPGQPGSQAAKPAKQAKPSQASQSGGACGQNTSHIGAPLLLYIVEIGVYSVYTCRYAGAFRRRGGCIGCVQVTAQNRSAFLLCPAGSFSDHHFDVCACPRIHDAFIVLCTWHHVKCVAFSVRARVPLGHAGIVAIVKCRTNTCSRNI